MIRKILIGVDNSKYAEKAAKYGFDIAKNYKAHVGLVNIVEMAAMPMTTNGADAILGSPMQAAIGGGELDLLNVQEQLSESIIGRISKKFGGTLQITHFNEYGSTADGIINCSKEFKADLIVIGTHSRSGLDRLLMGSVAEDVVRHSEIPVLVVPSKEG